MSNLQNRRVENTENCILFSVRFESCSRKYWTFKQELLTGPYAERLFNGIQLFEKTIRVRYKGSQRFDQNKYHELYEKLLERLVVENPDKYGGSYFMIISYEQVKFTVFTNLNIMAFIV